MKKYRIIWGLVFFGMALPLVQLIVLGASGGLGANPIEFINRYLGDWGLRTLLVALSATPLKLISGWTWPMRVRRMLGLWAFAYVALHLTSYVVLDQFFDWRAIGMDIVKRTYITVGMGAFIILATLAATSPKRVIKRLGGQAWKRIHKYIYIAGIMGCWHYYWMVKADTLPPLIHAAVLGVLLAIRLGYSYRPKKRLGS